jgi:hypothetical protein
VSNGTFACVDFVIVASNSSLVAEEVDRLEVDSSRNVLLVVEMLDAVCLVPTLGKDVKGDLAAD